MKKELYFVSIARCQLPDSQQLYCKYYQAKNKNEETNTVDPVHIADPLALWPVRILFSEIQIFCYLF
jgi:hypothetical protein